MKGNKLKGKTLKGINGRRKKLKSCKEVVERRG